METWSAGRIRATRHRVLNNSTSPRYSMAFFYDCCLDTVIEPLKVEHEDAAVEDGWMHVRGSYGEHLDRLIQANYKMSESLAER